MRESGARRIEREDRGADIAAELRLAVGRHQQMGDQRRRGRFTIGTGDGDERRIGRKPAPLPAISSTSPMTSTAALRARPTDQCGTGWVSGTPGVRTSAAISDQSIACKSAVGMPSAPASATCCDRHRRRLRRRRPPRARGRWQAPSLRGRRPRPACQQRW